MLQSLLIDVPLKRMGEGTEINISVYGDLHEEARVNDEKRLMAHMDARSKLPNARFIGLGDMGDWILPADRKRFVPSVRKFNPSVTGYDDIIDRELSEKVKKWKKYPWDFIAMGNHELEVLKRYYTNPSERLCQMLGARYGSYCGFARYRFVERDKNIRCACTFLYHHGAWGGRVVKGFSGARDFARMYEGWDVMLYGHNHQSVIHSEVRICQDRMGHLQDKNCYIVNTGTWLKTYSETNESPTYGEVKGYPPVALASPLIKIKINGNKELKISVTAGDE